MAAATKQTIARIIGAALNTTAPTTAQHHEMGPDIKDRTGRTSWCCDRKSSDQYSEYELLNKNSIDTSVDKRYCAATVVHRI
jgi:hypothetical protein